MPDLPRILILALWATTACSASTLPPERDYSDKTVSQVLDLLENGGPKVRVNAAVSLGYRYHHGIAVNAPTWKTQHPEFPLPGQLVVRLADHLKSDPNDLVRIVALRAIHDLRFWTNTTPALAAGLTNTDEGVRVEACLALIEVSQEYPEPLPEALVPTLALCLEADSSDERHWYAAWIAGQLGGAGQPLVPALKKLTKGKSSKVRRYAREAISKIRRAKEQPGPRAEGPVARPMGTGRAGLGGCGMSGT